MDGAWIELQLVHHFGNARLSDAAGNPLTERQHIV